MTQEGKITRSIPTPVSLNEKMLEYQRLTGISMTSLYNKAVEKFLEKELKAEREKTA